MQSPANEIIVFLCVATVMILLMAVILLGTLYFYRKRQISFLKEIEQIKSDYEKSLLSTQIEIQENTFQHISREIHDNISLSLTLAKLNLNTIDLYNLDKLKTQIGASLEQISKAIIDLSDISKSLSSEIIVNQGLLKALEKEIGKIQGMNFFRVRFSVTGDPVFMDSNKELIIFRIVQEAFNNIIKHAKATLVELKLTFDGNQINVFISDNGKGFSKEMLELNSDNSSKAGLNNIQKRAAIFNGQAIIESECGKGTSIFVSIPY